MWVLYEVISYCASKLYDDSVMADLISGKTRKFPNDQSLVRPSYEMPKLSIDRSSCENTDLVIGRQSRGGGNSVKMKLPREDGLKRIKQGEVRGVRVTESLSLGSKTPTQILEKCSKTVVLNMWQPTQSYNKVLATQKKVPFVNIYRFKTSNLTANSHMQKQ